MASSAVQFDAVQAASRSAKSVLECAPATGSPTAQSDTMAGECDAPYLDGNAGAGILWSLGLEMVAGVVLWGICWGLKLWTAHP